MLYKFGVYAWNVLLTKGVIIAIHKKLRWFHGAFDVDTPIIADPTGIVTAPIPAAWLR